MDRYLHVHTHTISRATLITTHCLVQQQDRQVTMDVHVRLQHVLQEIHCVVFARAPYELVAHIGDTAAVVRPEFSTNLRLKLQVTYKV